MPKRSKREATESTRPTKPPSEPKRTPDQAEADQLGIEYVQWKPGVFSFKCPAAGCPFDAVELAHLKKHITGRHLANPPASKLILTDKYGNPQPGPPGSGGNE